MRAAFTGLLCSLSAREGALRHYAASTWLCLGTPVHEVAEYLGDEARTVLAVYAHVLGEGQRRDHLRRLASAEQLAADRKAAEIASDPIGGTPGGYLEGNLEVDPQASDFGLIAKLLIRSGDGGI